jgi:RNA polymerase sigma-70 factor, ECF subfamily
MKPLNLTPDSRHDRTSLLRALTPSISAASRASVQAHLGRKLRVSYGNPAEEKLPSRFARLLIPGHRVIRADAKAIDRAFIDGIVMSLPPLRSFAISLTRCVDQAEDLVQETVLKAISKQEKFEAGTNLRAWLFTILRNQFFSENRKSMREVEDVDGSYAATMISMPDHEDRIMIQDLAAALAKLPQGQREAMMLVGLEGMTYDEAAQTLGCAIGTIQSRVNRARNRLVELMDPDRTERHRRGAAKAKNVFC